MRPGHIENCLLLISFSSVFLGGLNVAWWSYLIIAAFDGMESALYAMCLV